MNISIPLRFSFVTLYLIIILYNIEYKSCVSSVKDLLLKHFQKILHLIFWFLQIPRSGCIFHCGFYHFSEANIWIIALLSEAIKLLTNSYIFPRAVVENRRGDVPKKIAKMKKRSYWIFSKWYTAKKRRRRRRSNLNICEIFYLSYKQLGRFSTLLRIFFYYLWRKYLPNRLQSCANLTNRFRITPTRLA